MDLTNFSRRRIYRARRFRPAGQKGLDRLVCEVRRIRCGSSDATALPCRDYGRYIRDPHSAETGAHRTAMDGLLGILDRASASYRWHAGLGFRGTLGELGSALGSAPSYRVAQNTQGLVQIAQAFSLQRKNPGYAGIFVRQLAEQIQDTRIELAFSACPVRNFYIAASG